MRFLLDQGLPRSAVRHLQNLGHEAEHVGDVGMATAKDEVILAEGETRGAIVVTLDSDFHALLALSNASSPFIVLGFDGASGQEYMLHLKHIDRFWNHVPLP